MMVSLLFVLLGSNALAVPLEEDRAGDDGDDMILSSEQKAMFAEFVIKNEKDQEEADNYNEDEKPDKGGPQTGASRALKLDTWPGKILYYDLSDLAWPISWFLESKVKSALKDLQERTGNCVQFKERKTGPRVVVHSHGGCSSHIGYRGIEQDLTLGLGCYSKGIIQHEFMHALGFAHSQARSDRDTYIEVKTENVEEKYKHNFDKYLPHLISHYGLPFDFESIMLYPSNAFSKNGEMTIVARDKYKSKQNLIGNRKEASAGDIAMLKKAYGCK